MEKILKGYVFRLYPTKEQTINTKRKSKDYKNGYQEVKKEVKIVKRSS